MKSYEEYVAPQSDYYVYLPSLAGRRMFFYPLYCGQFIYMPGYHLFREAYDSFLLLYVLKGRLTLNFEGHTSIIEPGGFMFIDCYKPHAYFTEEGCETLWCHFDGPCARAFYDSIISRLGNSFSMINPYPVITKLNQIYDTFHDAKIVKEPLLSKNINDILTACLLYSPTGIKTNEHTYVIEEVIAYINEHFAEDLSVDDLAMKAGMSLYHFIRVFGREIGFTPHEYLVSIRINAAKHLLKNSKLSIKEICFNTGFSCESVFCNSFKKHTRMTPIQYRNST